jgi:hypothetical protein
MQTSKTPGDGGDSLVIVSSIRLPNEVDPTSIGPAGYRNEGRWWHHSIANTTANIFNSQRFIRVAQGAPPTLRPTSSQPVKPLPVVPPPSNSTESACTIGLRQNRLSFVVRCSRWEVIATKPFKSTAPILSAPIDHERIAYSATSG